MSFVYQATKPKERHDDTPTERRTTCESARQIQSSGHGLHRRDWGSTRTVLRLRTRYARRPSALERPRRLARNSVRGRASWNRLHENLRMPEQSVQRKVEFPFLSHVPRIARS